MSSRFDFELTFDPQRRRAHRRDADAAFRILVIGDFGGRADRRTALTDRRIHPVDLDDFDQVLAHIAPRAGLTEDGPDRGAEVTFDSLESFHPDSLYARLDAFAALRDLRTRLCDPGHFEQAAAELLATGVAAPAADPGSTHERAGESSDDLTARLLGRTASRRAGSAGSRFDDVIRRLVAPYIERDATAGSAPYLSALDEVTTATLRSVIHAPQFRRLEATWRGLRSLVDRLELADAITLSILDATRDELRADLLESSLEPESTQLYRRLAVGREDRLPSLIVVDFEFGLQNDDLDLLAALGAIGACVEAPVLAAAASGLLGVPDLATRPDPQDWPQHDSATAANWRALRASRVAPWIGLALPRLLLRQPYGAKSDPIDSFDFEEIPDEALHEAFLWGNPAYGCALLLGQAFAENGWSMAPGDVLELDDLPACVIGSGDARMLKPCAEAVLPERAIERLLQDGLMPFASYRDRNACRLARFQSISEPAAPLAGSWSA